MTINETLYARVTRAAVAGSSTLLVATLVAAIAFAAPALRAQESSDSKAFSWSGKMSASSWIRVKNLSGDIEVVASDGNTVEVTAEKRWSRGDPADVRFEILKDGDNVTICALWDNFREAYCDEDSYSHRGNSRNRNDVHVYFKVKLPRGVNVHVSTVNGSVDVAGARAHVIAAGVNGEVVVTASTGPVSANSVNGSVRVEMESLAGNDPMSFSSVNGTVTLTLPASFDADLTMSTVNGRLRSDFPILLEGRIDTQRMRGTIGKGGRKVKLSTVNGNIVLKKS